MLIPNRPKALYKKITFKTTIILIIIIIIYNIYNNTNNNYYNNIIIIEQSSHLKYAFFSETVHIRWMSIKTLVKNRSK